MVATACWWPTALSATASAPTTPLVLQASRCICGHAYDSAFLSFGGAVSIGPGDGSKQTFDTPFTGSTSIKTWVIGVETPNTILFGLGPGGVDQVVFAIAPADKAQVTAQANIGAVNVNVVQQCIVLATNEVKRYLARYEMDNLPADCLAMVNSPTVFYTRWFLRERKNMNDYPPILEQKKSVDAWLMGVATGKIALPASAPVATAVLPPDPPAVRAEPSVFEPPYSSFPGGTGNGFWW